jgi:hypothetical protein
VMVGGVTGLAAANVSLAVDRASAHGTLASHNEIDNDTTIYEIDGLTKSWPYNPTFYSRLEAWAQFYYNNTPSTWLKPIRLWSFGAHVDRCSPPSSTTCPGWSEAHGNGRGFDLTRIYATVSGSLTLVADLRYYVWKGFTGSTLTTYRRWYWGTAASGAYHFQYILHYNYNSAHDDHIHLDNLVSNSGNSVLNTSSTSQIKLVQSCLRYVWGYPVTIDGVWGSQTSSYASQAIVRSGGSGSLTASQSNWLLFCRTSTRFGTGAQAY